MACPNKKIILPLTPNCSYPELKLNIIEVEGDCNDQIAIGPSIFMNTYCKLYEKLEEYNKLGIINSSSCLYHHLQSFCIHYFIFLIELSHVDLLDHK